MPNKPKYKIDPVNIEDETIGQRLARIRKEKGLTQQQIADKIGITRSLLSNYEIGRIRIYHDMLAQFSKALGVSSDELLGLKPHMYNETKGQIIERFRRKAKLTQQNLADKLSIKRVYLSYYENDKIDLDNKTASKIAKILKVSLEDILNPYATDDLVTENSPHYYTTDEIIEMIKNLPNEAMKSLHIKLGQILESKKKSR